MITQQVYRRPFKVVSLKEKLAILRQIESGSSRREIQEIFKCSQPTICRILLSKESILQEAKTCNGDKRENLTANNNVYKELYKELTKWAKEVRQTNGVITAHLARKKSEELSRNMGQELSPSNAWLYRWKERENILFAKKHNEPEYIIKDSVKKQREMQLENINKKTSERIKLSDKETRFLLRQEDISQDIPKIFNKHRSKKEYIKKLPPDLKCRSRKETKFLTLLQKLELVRRLRNGERRIDLIVEYNLSQSAMSQIVNEEEKILRVAAKGQNLQMKRIRGGIFRDGEAELNNWVLQKMAKGENLTKAEIKKRAKEIAERLRIDFKASTGWLEKWKARMNMEFNENQILHRKVPKYLANDANSNIETKEHSDVVNDNFEFQEIKQEITDYNYDDITDNSREELNCEIQSEYLTPQQFYLQTMENDDMKKDQREKVKMAEDKEKKENESEETEIKLFTVSSLRLGSTDQVKETLQDTTHSLKEKYKVIKEENKREETELNKIAIEPQFENSLQERVHNWLNRFHIEPLAAKELLDILGHHLDEESKNFKNPIIDHRVP